MDERERIARLEERLQATEKAIEVAHSSMQERLRGMNEFRETLRDQANTLLPRSEWNIKHESIERDLRELREHRARLDGKADQKTVNFLIVVSVISIAVSLIGVILHWLK